MRPLSVAMALLLALLGWSQAELCKTCIWVGTAKTTTDMGLVFVADLTATPRQALGPNGTEIAYSVQGVVRPSSQGAALSLRRTRPRGAEVVTTADLSVNFATGTYISSIGVNFPIVGADRNVILKPDTTERLLLVDSRMSASNALRPGGKTLSGTYGKAEWNLTLVPAPPKTMPGGALSGTPAQCPTCVWTGRFTTTSRQGTLATAAVTLTPVEVRGPVVRYRASASITHGKVPQLEAGRADCRSEFLSPFTLDDAQYVEIDFSRRTYRGVLTAQAEGLTRCSTKTVAFTDEVVLFMTVSPGGVDQPWAGGTSLGGQFTLNQGTTTSFALTQLGEGQAPATVPALSTPSTPALTANCGKCIWVGTSMGTLQTLGMRFTAQVTLTPTGIMREDGLMPYRATATFSVAGNSRIPGCKVSVPGGNVTSNLKDAGTINYRKQTFNIYLIHELNLDVSCTGAAAMMSEGLSRSIVYLTKTGAGDGLSLSENGTRFSGSDQNLKWDFRLQR